jgi:hypothetical protein
MKAFLYYLAVFVGLVFVSVPANASGKTYKLIQGEGNAPGALLSLNSSNNFQLDMFCNKTPRQGTLALMLSVVVEHSNLVSPQVAKLNHTPYDEKPIVDVCINGQCQSKTWEASEEGGDQSGGAVVTDIVIGTVHKRIRSLRIVVPNDSTNYKFQGDVDAPLKAICRNEE